MRNNDITDEACPALRKQLKRRGMRLYRLEKGTLMARHTVGLDTNFFFDEEDAVGQWCEGKPPKRRDLKPTKEMRERRPHHTDDAAQDDLLDDT
jgi:hypothetical protein